MLAHEHLRHLAADPETLRIEQKRDAGYIITRCLFCQGRIIHRGSVAEGGAAADLHRETKHPSSTPRAAPFR